VTRPAARRGKIAWFWNMSQFVTGLRRIPCDGAPVISGREIMTETHKMQFMLTGFTQDTGFRVFSFEGVTTDRVRSSFTVKADLALTRRYGIQMQDLPLLCRSLLERRDENTGSSVFIFSEDEMRTYASERAALREAAAHKRKPPRRPSGENLGAAWRGLQPKQPV
jgi:hypothetical protein